MYHNLVFEEQYMISPVLKYPSGSNEAAVAAGLLKYSVITVGPLMHSSPLVSYAEMSFPSSSTSLFYRQLSIESLGEGQSHRLLHVQIWHHAPNTASVVVFWVIEPRRPAARLGHAPALCKCGL